MGDTLTSEKSYLLLSGAISANLQFLSPEVVKHYLEHKDQIPFALARGFTVAPNPLEKFALLADLGIITVKADYVHGKQISSFLEKYPKMFYDYDKNITDANFPRPSRILKPGDKLWVRAYKQIVGGTTTSEERMTFLETQNVAIYTGAQGSSLVFEQKRDQLPKGFWYASFDKEERLWKDSDGNRGVPGVHADLNGDFNWSLGYLEGVWDVNRAFFGFCDLSSET
ncbi:MAG: hypothetical protein HY507_00110 [Candidatus Zambryskibacteria bacterium]|nr:hypothetical protein [Candidatus Zambryskibacteria bacterium]